MNPHSPPFIALHSVSKTYVQKNAILRALTDISLEIGRGEILGIVGESGSGKSTLGKILSVLETPTHGEVIYKNQKVESLNSTQRREMRRTLQVIYQDPYSSLNPMMSIEQCIGEGIDIHKIAYGEEKREIIKKLLFDVGLPPEVMERFPHEFSGGQRQRIVIARALAVNPEFLVCDEPLASLDTCTQRQVMDLFRKLKAERGLTMLFISHDISAVKAIADHVAVMYLGSIVEQGPTEHIINKPCHPYTKALIGSIPLADPAAERAREKIILLGDPPSPFNPPEGCAFHPRCRFAEFACKHARPELGLKADGRKVACHQV